MMCIKQAPPPWWCDGLSHYFFKVKDILVYTKHPLLGTSVVSPLLNNNNKFSRLNKQLPQGKYAWHLVNQAANNYNQPISSHPRLVLSFLD